VTTQADRIALALRDLAPGKTFLPEEVPIINALGASWEARLKATVPPVAAVPVGAGFKLGQRSSDRVVSLKPELRQTVELAITLSVQDFTVLEVVRSLADQQKAVATGHSRTMKSKHLRQADGFSWAVDLGAWVNGAVSWEFARYADIAHAMDQAATRLGFEQHIRWGCAWDRVLADFGGGRRDAYLAAAQAYAERHPGKDLVDGPHFEWVA
jgi:peptidoglycan L-alanyl-D-glutamate endopeptidase CwlK